MMCVSYCTNGDMSKYLFFMKVVVKLVLLFFAIVIYICPILLLSLSLWGHYGVILLTINIIIIIHIIIVIMDIIYAYFNVS